MSHYWHPFSLCTTWKSTVPVHKHVCEIAVIMHLPLYQVWVNSPALTLEFSSFISWTCLLLMSTSRPSPHPPHTSTSNLPSSILWFLYDMVHVDNHGWIVFFSKNDAAFNAVSSVVCDNQYCLVIKIILLTLVCPCLLVYMQTLISSANIPNSSSNNSNRKYVYL